MSTSRNVRGTARSLMSHGNRVEADMTEPAPNDVDVDAGLEQVDGSGVAPMLSAI